jgi:DNA helicase-2/ATP-dependent DNA helicase PcrA
MAILPISIEDIHMNTQLQPIELTNEQWLAINDPSTHKFINAGPGTGKTTTLCGAIAHLTQKGEKPGGILSITFSKAAADNMSQRLAQMSIDIKCWTLHAWGLNLINKHGSKLGFTSKAKVAGQRKSVDPLQSAIKINTVNYDDMIELPIKLLKEFPEVRNALQKQVKHLLVDEVQDLSEKQIHLLYLLSREVQSTLMVGDKKQRIFSFQGACGDSVEKLKSKLKPVEHYLTETHRVPKKMLGLVNAVARDINSEAPPLKSNVYGSRPVLYLAKSNQQQASFIAKQTQMLIKQGVPSSQIVIIGRTNRSLIFLKDTLEMQGIMFNKEDRPSRDESIKLLRRVFILAKALKRCQVNASDKRVHRSNRPSKLKPSGKEFGWKKKSGFSKPKTLNNLLIQFGVKKSSRQNIINKVCQEGWHEFRLPLSVDGRVMSERIRKLGKNIQKASTLAPEKGTQLLIDSLKPLISSLYKKDKLAILTDYKNIKLLLRDYATWNEVDFNDLLQQFYSNVSFDKNGIELITAHKAKGREWSHVFLINMVEGEFPQIIDPKMDEEICVFYVAITRASQKLYVVVSPVHRNIYGKQKHGKWVSHFEKISPFVENYESKFHVIH